MAEAQLRQFLDKVRQLNAFVAMSEADPRLRQELCDCEHHDQVVALARRCGFEIGRRWGEPVPGELPSGEIPVQADPADPVPVPAPLPEGSPPIGGVRSPQQQPTPPEVRFGGDAAVAAAALIWRREQSGPDAGQPLAGSLLEDARLFGSARQEGAVRAGGPGSVSASDPAAGVPISARAPFANLLAGPCPPPGAERTDVLLQTPFWRLERIHSCASRSPEGFWYDQQEHEWVLLLQGEAALRFEDQPDELRLRPGDSFWISPRRRHRVTATDPAPGTIWLALFWRTA